MILADANVFLRFLTSPKNDDEARFAEQASVLFQRASTERSVFTTTDAVVAEVVFILSAPRHFGFSRAHVYDLMTPVIRLPGCAIARKHTLASSLMLWLSHPSISFVDSICLAESFDSGNELMTFDVALKRVESRERASSSRLNQ